MKIDFLQRVILLHSYLYYHKNVPYWSDKKYDEIAKQLEGLQNKYSKNQIRDKTQYGYVFYDYTAGTGFDLFDRLKSADKDTIISLSDVKGFMQEEIKKRKDNK